LAIGYDGVPAAVPGLQIEIVEGECLVYHPQHTRAIYLNASAALVLGLCNGTRTAHEISQMIRDGYPEAQTDEVLSTLAQLEEYGVVVVA
jgi:hypothetical protein